MFESIALVDVSCLFKRTFEANPNAGAKNTLEQIVQLEDRVAHVILCLDAPPYSRKEIFADYKANRPEPEPTEVYQKRWLYEQLKERGYPIARLKGAEADDVIATLARIYGESCPDVWLVGADKDLAQCVTDNVRQLIPSHGERAEHFRGPKEVKEKFEVDPGQMPLWLALVGDKSDNIPGVKGIGPVKAAGLIRDYRTLTGIAENLKSIGGQVGKALSEGWEQLVLSLKLTTLDTRLPLDHQALLVRAERKAPADEPEFTGNETPMPEVIVVPPHHDEKLAPDAAFDEMVAKGSRPEPIIGEDPRAVAEDEARRRAAQVAAEQAKLDVLTGPQPLIGKDPRADEFLRQQHAERNADRAAREAQERELDKERQEQEFRKKPQPKKEPAVFASEHPDFPKWGTPGFAPVQGPSLPDEVATRLRREREAVEGFIPISPPPAVAAPPREPARATITAMPPVKATLRGLALLRAPFEKHQISKLPKGTKAQNDCAPSEKRNCNICGGWHHPKIIHLDYVGHAALTDRLLEADPQWTWEPMAYAPNGLPLLDPTGGLWIKLTVCGVTRLGYGHAKEKKGEHHEPGAREKELIGDALRNAAMRFGAALDLWHKGDDLHADDWDPADAWTDATGEVA